MPQQCKKEGPSLIPDHAGIDYHQAWQCTLVTRDVASVVEMSMGFALESMTIFRIVSWDHEWARLNILGTGYHWVKFCEIWSLSTKLTHTKIVSDRSAFDETIVYCKLKMDRLKGLVVFVLVRGIFVRVQLLFGDARLFKQYSFRLSGFYLHKISFISVDFV